jgi:cytochrome d ubiquinol oxidase subunit II
VGSILLAWLLFAVSADRCDARLHRLAAWLRPPGGGAGWLILKSEGALQDWAWKRIPWLAGAALAVVCVAFIIALGDRDRISGALPRAHVGSRVPFIDLLAIYVIFLSLRLRPQALPFTMTVLLFVAAFLTKSAMSR